MKVGLLFPGCGSQFVGMGKALYDNHRVVQELFEEASHCLDKNFVKLCFATSDNEIGSVDNLFASIFLVSSSIFSVFKEAGLPYDIVTGYALGEYSAAFAGGSLSFHDTIYLISKYTKLYGELLKELGETVAVVRIVGLPEKTIEQLVAQANSGVEEDGVVASISSFSEPDFVAVSGPHKAVERVSTLAESAGAKKIMYGFEEEGLHSPMMDPLMTQYSSYMTKVDFKDSSVPLINNVSGKEVTCGDDVKHSIVQQINSPIRWSKILRSFGDCSCLVQIGPGTSLKESVQKVYPDKKVFSVNSEEDLEAVKRFIEYMTPAKGDLVDSEEGASE